MRKGFKVETREFNKWARVLIVCNYEEYNLVVNWPMPDVGHIRQYCDVGVWRVKKIKNNYANRRTNTIND